MVPRFTAAGVRATSEKLVETSALKSKVRGLEEDGAAGKAAIVFFAGDRGSRHPLIM